MNNNNDNDDEEIADTPQQVEEEAKKKPRIGKLQGDKMKEVLVEYYLSTDTTKLLTFIQQKDLFSNKNAIARHWKDGGLEQNKLLSKHISQAKKEYDDWCVDEKKKQSETNKNNATEKKLDDYNQQLNGLPIFFLICTNAYIFTKNWLSWMDTTLHYHKLFTERCVVKVLK